LRANLEKNAHDKALEKKKEKLVAYVNAYLLDFCRQYPSTQFYCIFPPYFRYRYAKFICGNSYNYLLHQFAVRYFVQEAHKLSNVHIYGFEDMDFLDDIKNYNDTSHYHQKYNSLMLNAIAEGKHRITMENVDAYLQEATRKLFEFDLEALNQEAQRLLRKQGTIQ